MNCAIIGVGNIGKIILKSLLKNKDKISISNRTFEKIEQYSTLDDVSLFKSNLDCVKNADVIYLCVKPYQIKDLLAEIEPNIKNKATIVSVAAGVTIAQLKSYTKNKFNYVRLLPNTPSSISLGVTLVSYSDYKDLSVVNSLSYMGSFYEINENMMDLGSTTCGSLPAYVYMMIDSYINSALRNGMEYSLAKKLVTETFIGAATLFENSDKEGKELISNVCSKGGSTIEGVKSLENNHFERIIGEAFDACLKRTKELGKE